MPVPGVRYTLAIDFFLLPVPPILAAVADARNSTAFAMIVPVMFFISAETYALAVNFVPSYRDRAYKIGEGVVGTGEVVATKGDIEKVARDNSEEGSLEDKAAVYEKEDA